MDDDARTPPAPTVPRELISRTLVDLAVDSAGIGTYEWDLRTGELRWDERTMALFGHDAGTFDGSIASFDSRVHPEDLPHVRRRLQSAIDQCGEYALEYRVVRPDGTTRWLEARGRVLCGSGGSTTVTGAVLDTTTTREADTRVARVLETMPTAFFSLDRSWRFTYVNAHAEQVLGHSREELIGRVLWDLFPAAVGSDFETYYRRAMERSEPVAFDAYYPEPLEAWYEVRAWPVPEGLSVYFLDVTARRRLQRDAEAAAERAQLTATVTAELSRTLDAEQAVAQLARTIVPMLGDWCVISLTTGRVSPSGIPEVQDIGWWHVDPELRPVVRDYATARVQALTPGAFLPRALETGETIVIPQDAREVVSGVLRPGAATAALAVLDPGSVAVLPLRGRGRTVGAITLFSGTGRAPMTPEELTVAGIVADRAGLALDNAYLYREQRQMAEALQRALLTEPPEPDHLEIQVRYVPAAEVAKVGGDWYDAFLQPSGATTVVIGDVTGHDQHAAAAMGQLRSLTRGIAVSTGDGPGALLTKVDQALRTLQMPTIATVVALRLEQDEAQVSEGTTTLRWSNAGHPPPVLLLPDGSTRLLTAPSDLLLGVVPETVRHEHTVTAPRDSTVVMYTDGLVERRGRLLRDGIASLQQELTELGDLPLGDLCDALLERLLPDAPSDDVALVAVRLHPQDRPRPPEAGPVVVPPDVPPDPAA